MRLADQFRKCVAFLRIEEEDKKTGLRELQVKATAFIVQVPVGENAVTPYVVTAAHVVQKARARKLPLVLRMNLDDGWEDIEIAPDAWAEHPTSDVAVTEVEFSQEAWRNCGAVPLELLVDDEFAAKYDIGEGDEVFMPGLFTSVPGETRDEPIVRFGHVALAPRDLTLEIPSGKTKMAAWLVETRSWGGESGSPVFVSFMGAQGFAPPREGMSKILGLIHGHYEIPAKVAFASSNAEKATTPLNAGIAAVIPAQKIIDVLMQEDFVTKRDEDARKIADERPTPVPDIADSDPSEFDRFEDLTRKLVQTPKPEKDKES